LKNIADEQIQFDHVLSALPEDMVGQILDLVESAPEAAPYTFLKARILETHQLSDYEKFDMLVKMEPLGDRKPSQLLAAMMEYCPAGMEKILPFHYFLTQRLPIALRTQLGEVEHGDPRALAARADRLWTMHSPSGSTVACVEPAASAVAAIRGSSRGHGGRGRGGSQRGRGAQRASLAAGAANPGTAATGGTAAADPAPSALARLSSGILRTRPRSVRVPAAGETSRPGTPQRRRPWATCPRGGSDF
jgi:hypothetical protein